jgi:hypothetical protein
MKISDLYTCPRCGKHELEEILTDVTVASLIETINEDGEMEYSTVENTDGELDRYACADCGCHVGDNGSVIKDPEELYEYLINLKKENAKADDIQDALRELLNNLGWELEIIESEEEEN